MDKPNLPAALARLKPHLPLEYVREDGSVSDPNIEDRDIIVALNALPGLHDYAAGMEDQNADLLRRLERMEIAVTLGLGRASHGMAGTGGEDPRMDPAEVRGRISGLVALAERVIGDNPPHQPVCAPSRCLYCEARRLLGRTPGGGTEGTP